MISAIAAAETSPVVDFNRDVRPILSDKCWRCHGPDEKNRKGDLRLDTEEGAIGKSPASAKSIVRARPQDSELFRRIVTSDNDERMPPADSGLQLTQQQIDTIKRWIEQGAPWAKHWSFVPLQRPALPKIAQNAFADHLASKNPVDLFVQERLLREKLTPSESASRETQIRRVTLDLTGLPPSLDEVEAFLADRRPDAYERLVDRLLASPRYGERMGIRWLEAARYADTSGYQSDGPRYMWRWRDWVLQALNHDKPFDQFTIEQLAGDLLPNASRDQVIATGFNRNHRGNSEGGIIPEEFAVEYVVDRVETTCTTWLGLTMGCVRCHDHKFDPLTQRDFYQLYAYFNSIPEAGRAIKEGNSPPYMAAPTMHEESELLRLQSAWQKADKNWRQVEPQLKTAFEAWQREVARDPAAVKKMSASFLNWSFRDGLIASLSLGKNSELRSIQKAIGSETNPPATPIAPKDSTNDLGAEFTGKNFYDAGDVGVFGYFDKFTLAARILARGDGTILSRMTDAPQADGYYVQRVNGRLQVNLVKRWLDDSIRVETRDPIPDQAWLHLTVTYDGSRLASGVRVYLNGNPVPMKVHLDGLNQTFATKEPFRIGAGGGDASGFRGQISDVQVFDRSLSEREVLTISAAASIQEIAQKQSIDRTPAESAKLHAAFLDTVVADDIRNAYQNRLTAKRKLEQFEASISDVMVMKELPQPRDAFVLVRGEYDKPGEKVSRGVPAALPALSPSAEVNRLGFAKWLVSPDHPLTARVTVNRAWQQFFPVGLVKTSEDFGSQGEAPSHPQLLDWLAAEFTGVAAPDGSASGVRAFPHAWSQKMLHRTIVTSGTYRQSSKVPPMLLQRDPENRLLARGPRFRLPAEMIRDQALAVGGMLVERIGGPSVKPYQPDDFWKDLANDSQYTQSRGADLYRRGLYTYWRRTVSPPTLVTFDAANRDTCTVKPTRTNTPLQALTLLNEVTYVEAARVLAERMLELANASAAERVRFAFRRVTCRVPSDVELQILVESVEQYRKHFRTHPEEAAKLIRNGDHPSSTRFTPADIAAYGTLASVLLNLDEVVTRE